MDVKDWLYLPRLAKLGHGELRREERYGVPLKPVRFEPETRLLDSKFS